MSLVTFRDVSASPRTWSVTGTENGNYLGRIVWKNSDRGPRYGFLASDFAAAMGIGYESLKELADFCKMRTEEYLNVTRSD